MRVLGLETDNGYVRVNPDIFFVLCNSRKQMSALAYVIDNADDANFIKWSYDDICSTYGVSKATVSIGVKKLKEADIIRDAGPNLWMFNPEMEWVGPEDRRQKAIEIYNSLEKYRPKC